ncbi:putative virion core protein (lumpy skin disease virus) [Paenibacillus pasadenensis]|uniref:Putative virion core protein (Lumpy skin disease virus) n=1 Tax=Paenibacillus pasadenensis TaxID=217090 RepID=A0A2N5MZY4_9BACL|nr:MULTISPECIES: SPFH domain-containing protein [Paenibacillus]PLT43622.1 putative virion core protein (lumpy skin disease virus) [Paenibacillus pasadenensis]QGG54257.1 zinc-ribbon domain-containing protein [Paenibacillus sp. B01]
MGIFDFLKGQFIEVIEWLDGTGDMVYRFPVYDNAIKMGAKLVVRESQAAIFVNEGQIADVFGPGTYTLSTQNLPVLTALRSWKYGFNSPFKADVYFVSTRNFTQLKWGTTNPVLMRDAEFGMVRLRGYGTYALRVGDPALFLKEIFGTQASFSAESIAGYLKSLIVSGVSDLLGESRIPAIDLAASYDELGQTAAAKLQPRFAAMGLSLTALTVENLSLPEEVEKAVDRRSSMGVVGNLDTYLKYQSAEAVREAANNPGGDAGAGIGLGAGMAMGQALGRALAGQGEPAAADNAAASPPGAAGAAARSDGPPSGGQPARGGEAPAGGAPADRSAAPEAPAKKFCSECGQPLAPGAKFCSNCGTKV